MTDRTPGPFCVAPGCLEPAEGAVLFAYTKEQRRYLCVEHLKPIRLALLEVLTPLPAVDDLPRWPGNHDEPTYAGE